jgi:hypothetical protein
MCDSFQPTPVADDLSYGYAIQVSDAQTENHPNCCKCYEITWLNGGAEGKRMIAQVLTPGGSAGDIRRDDLILLVPGGGLGPLNQGCPNQYGRNVNWWVTFTETFEFRWRVCQWLTDVLLFTGALVMAGTQRARTATSFQATSKPAAIGASTGRAAT